MSKVQKRDGRIVNFDSQKIIDAIEKAFKQVDGEVTPFAHEKAKNIAAYIEKKSDEKVLTIEDIQDYVENGLMSTKRKDVARAYIQYRQRRTIERERNSTLHKQITEKILASDVKNQNANVDEYSFGGRKGEATSVYMKNYALNYLISPKFRDNHINNRIYIHDLDSYAVGMHNCLSIPFDELLRNGFTVRQTDVRPARSISTAFQLVAVIFQLQSLDQFGGVSATHLDWTMVPYVRISFYKHFCDGLKYVDGVDTVPDTFHEKMSIEDPAYMAYPKAYKYAYDMTVNETYQAVEGMYHNLKLGRLNSNIKNLVA